MCSSLSSGPSRDGLSSLEDTIGSLEPSGGGGASPFACPFAHPFADAFAWLALSVFNGLAFQRDSAASLFLSDFSSTQRRSFVSLFCSQPFSVSDQKAMTTGLSTAHFFTDTPSIWASLL